MKSRATVMELERGADGVFREPRTPMTRAAHGPRRLGSAGVSAGERRVRVGRAASIPPARPALDLGLTRAGSLRVGVVDARGRRRRVATIRATQPYARAGWALLALLGR